MDREKSDEAAVALPMWQSHKRVWADKIIRIEAMDVPAHKEQPVKNYAGADWILDCGARIYVTTDLIARGNPKIGDYYVQYKDGYQSWSPAAAFLEGYTQVHE